MLVFNTINCDSCKMEQRNGKEHDDQRLVQRKDDMALL